MLRKIVAVLILVGLAFGSNTNNEFETNYIVGCMAGYKNEGKIPLQTFTTICVCAWQGVEARYSNKELTSLYNEKIETVNSKLAGDFMKFNVARAEECLNLQKVKN